MKHSISALLTAGVAALVVVSSAGCVSQKSLDEVRAVAERSAQEAAAAKTAADAAMRAATDAKSTATNAQGAAERAAQAAQAAAAAGKACCDATNEKLDRMFQKSVSK